MSITIALIYRGLGLVASDRRLSSPAVFDKGTLITKSTIQSDIYDKTFKVDNGRIIGAVTGIMEFQKRKVEMHLAEIMSTDCVGMISPIDKLNCLAVKFRVRLENIEPTEILFNERTTEILFVTTQTGKTSDINYYVYRFEPDYKGSNIILKVKHPDEPKSKNCFWIPSGDNQAQDAVHEHLNKDNRLQSSPSLLTLKKVALDAITTGMKKSGKHKYGDHQSCGGNRFVRNL